MPATAASCGGDRRIQPEVITGITTAVSADATEVGLKDERTGQFIGGYDVGAADGRDCLVPESAGETISLGVVRTMPTDAPPGVRPGRVGRMHERTSPDRAVANDYDEGSEERCGKTLATETSLFTYG
jgi:hypothetical protein